MCQAFCWVLTYSDGESKHSPWSWGLPDQQGGPTDTHAFAHTSLPHRWGNVHRTTKEGLGWGCGCDLAPRAVCPDWMTQGSQAQEAEGSKEEADGGNAAEKRK